MRGRRIRRDITEYSEEIDRQKSVQLCKTKRSLEQNDSIRREIEFVKKLYHRTKEDLSMWENCSTGKEI
jgi:hypothetical protein